MCPRGDLNSLPAKSLTCDFDVIAGQTGCLAAGGPGCSGLCGPREAAGLTDDLASVGPGSAMDLP